MPTTLMSRELFSAVDRDVVVDIVVVSTVTLEMVDGETEAPRERRVVVLVFVFVEPLLATSI